MEGMPSLTIETTSLLYNEIPCYRRNSLTIEGHALGITTYNSWTFLTIGRHPLLMSKEIKQSLTIERNPLPSYSTKQN